MMFDIKSNDLFEIIGELYVEKHMASRHILEQNNAILNLEQKLQEQEINGREVDVAQNGDDDESA